MFKKCMAFSIEMPYISTAAQALYIQYLHVRALQTDTGLRFVSVPARFHQLHLSKGKTGSPLVLWFSIPGNSAPPPQGTLARCPSEMEPTILFAIICTMRCYQCHSICDSHISLDSGSLFRGRGAW